MPDATREKPVHVPTGIGVTVNISNGHITMIRNYAFDLQSVVVSV